MPTEPEPNPYEPPAAELAGAPPAPWLPFGELVVVSWIIGTLVLLLGPAVVASTERHHPRDHPEVIRARQNVRVMLGLAVVIPLTLTAAYAVSRARSRRAARREPFPPSGSNPPGLLTPESPTGGGASRAS